MPPKRSRRRKRGKQFIDMKNAVTFKLVARSTEDPLFCDPEAPQYVLVEKKSKDVIPIELDDNVGPEKKKLDKDARRVEQAKFGVYFDDDYDYLQHLIDAEDVPTLKGIEIVSKASIQNDDHSEPEDWENAQPSTSKGAIPKKPTLMLPSSVFESAVREKEALTKRAALPVGPQLDWDPDVVEAMDDDFNFEDPNNQIDDDFVSQAMIEGGSSRANEDDDSYLYDFAYKTLPKKLPAVNEDQDQEYDDDEDDDDDDLSVCGAASGSDDYDSDEARDMFPNSMAHIKDLMAKKHMKRFFQMGDDDQFDDGATAKSTGSHFTEYSMSSSVVPRSDQLRQLDSQFEKLFLSEYGDEEAIGALDGDEEFDDENTKMDESQQELIKAALEEYAEAKQERAGIEYVGNKEAISFVRARYLSKKATANGGDSEASEESSDSDSEYEEVEVVDPGRKGDKERLDCESVLSTYSNTTYHPKVLRDTDRYGNVLLGRQKVRPNHIRFDPRTGMPLAPAGTASNEPLNLTSDNLAKLNALETGTVRTNATRVSELSLRPKNETAEERKARKKELKDYRAQRRAEKKANKIAFTEEKLRMAKQSLNSVVQKKVAVL